MRNKLNALTWSRSDGDHPGAGRRREEGGLRSNDRMPLWAGCDWAGSDLRCKN